MPRGFADRAGKCFPSVRTLAACTGQPKSTMSRHLPRSSPGGVIARRRRPGGVYDYQIAGVSPRAAGVPPAREGVPQRRDRETDHLKNRDARARRFAKQGELRRDGGRSGRMGGAAARLAQVGFLVAFLRSETQRGGLLCTGIIDELIASGLSLRRSSRRFPLAYARCLTTYSCATGDAMPYNLPQAAAAVGRDRSTILRAIKAGKLSATRDAASNGWLIEPAELHRLYAVNQTHSSAMQTQLRCSRPNSRPNRPKLRCLNARSRYAAPSRWGRC